MDSKYNYELSVVLPCLNEEESIGICIKKIKQAFKAENISGEIVVSDNGSTDSSVKIAETLGVRVVFEPQKGYGSALRRGIEESKGQYVVMGDADDTYDFLEIPKFLKLLKQGNDLVMGTRFKGKILPGAMSWSHRYIGNPILSGMLRIFFGTRVSDSHCGLRGFSRSAYNEMNLQTTGMEFASEIVIHAVKKRMKIAEIPINLHPRKGEAKMESFKDAWRHIRFMLLYSPNYLFFLPGLIIFLIGILLLIRLAFGDIFFMNRYWSIHLMVFSGVFVILGWQILSIWFIAKIYTFVIGLEESRFVKTFLKVASLEKIIVLGLLLFLAGIIMLAYIIFLWAQSGFGQLTQEKLAMVALIIIVIAVQTVFTSFLASVLQIRYR